MPRRLYSEDLILNVIINGEKAAQGNSLLRNELYKTERAARDLEVANMKAEAKKAEIIKTNKEYAKSLAEVTSALDKEKMAHDENIKKREQYRKNIKEFSQGTDENSKTLKDHYTKEVKRLTQEIQASLPKLQQLKKKQEELKNATKANTTEYNKLENQIKQNKAQIETFRAKINSLQQQIGIAGMTINQLNGYLSSLRIQLNNSTDPRIMARLRNEIIRTENRIKQLVTGASRLSIAFERMGTVANKFGTITSWIAIASYAFGRAVGGTVKTLRDLDKEFSNVMKSTDLTREEMWGLKQQFDQLNNTNEGIKTPTATKDLLEIARIAGRLGVRGVKDIAEFTMAVDKLYVALGEDLEGEVEDVAEKIGKLVTTFRMTEEMDLGEAMLRAGSLINELSKSSAAGAETILNYTSRLGGVGSMAKFSMDQLAGLGAALDSVGVPAERGSTALAKLIVGMGEHAEEFARALGMTNEDYRKSMETNINETMLKLIEASATGNASIMDVVAGMDKMDVSGVRVMEVYGKLVQNMDQVIKQQSIAKAAFSSSASVMNEFYIMSKDFDSLMALQGKRWKALADDYAKRVAPAVYKLYRFFTDVAYALKDVVGWIARHSNGLMTLIGVMVAFKSASIVKTIVETTKNIIVWGIELKRSIVLMLRHNATVVSMYVAYTRAGKGIAGLTAAMKALGKAMITNPFTSLIAILGLVAGAVFLFRKRTDELTSAINRSNDEIKKQDTGMKELFDTVEKLTEGTKERKDGIQKINTLYGEYLQNILDETASNIELGDAYAYASKKMKEKIYLQMQETELSGATEKSQKNFLRGIESLTEKGEKNAYTMSLIRGNLETIFDDMMGFADQSGKITDKQIEDIQKYLRSVGVKAVAGEADLIRQIYAVRLKIEKAQADFRAKVAGYSAGKTQTPGAGKGETEKEGWMPMIDEKAYEDENKRLELQYKQRLNLIQENALKERKSKEVIEKEKQKAELEYINAQIDLEKDRWTRLKYVIENGRKTTIPGAIQFDEEGFKQSEQFIDLEAQRLNLMGEKAERKVGGGGTRTSATGQATQEMEDYKTRVTELYVWGKITKEQYDAALVELEEFFWEKQMGKFKAGSEEYTDAYQKWLEVRLKKKETAIKAEEQINEAVSMALNWDWSKSEKEKPDEDVIRLAESIAEKRKRVRQFLSLDKKEGIEAEFGVFDEGNFAGQLQQLDTWYKQGIITHDEYERRKTEITRDQEKERLKYAKEGIGVVNDILGTIGELFEAQKNKELELAGDNEAKKEEIARKYARKQRTIMIAQAVMKGGMAIMDLLGNNMIPWPARTIYNAIMIPLIAAQTAMQIAVIKSQQFMKGNYPVDQLRNWKTKQYDDGSYPVMGADDGKVYNAQYVGPVQTGVYRKPSLGLFAERPEMVIDYPTLRNIQMNNPRLIDSILAHRNYLTPRPLHNGEGAKQYAEGNYPVGAMTAGIVNDGEIVKLLQKNNETLNKLLAWRPTVYTELIKKDLETLESINRNSRM